MIHDAGESVYGRDLAAIWLRVTMLRGEARV
jgi:hypothetical protein